MKLAYAERWARRFGKAIDPIDKEAAKQLHDDRMPYCSVIYSEQEPVYVVELNGAYVNVIFLDDQQRNYLEYEFQELEPGRIFFKQSRFHRFAPDGRLPLTVELCQFNPEGSFFMVRADYSAKTRSKSDTSTFDPAPNWEKYPQFTRYGALLVKEREVSSALP